MTNSWSEMFDQRGPRSNAPTERAQPALDDVELAPDLSVYKPWTLQRGRSHPTLTLELRRFDPRAGAWSGWHLSYPSFVAAEFTGDRVLSLDFGTRHFILEGRGLDELARYLQLGTVVSVQEHAGDLWPAPANGGFVRTIKPVLPSSTRQGH